MMMIMMMVVMVMMIMMMIMTIIVIIKYQDLRREIIKESRGYSSSYRCYGNNT